MGKKKKTAPPRELITSEDGYFEINVGGLRDKVDGGVDRLLYRDGPPDPDAKRQKGTGRLRWDPMLRKGGIFTFVAMALALAVGAALGAAADFLIVCGVLLGISFLLVLLCLWEIRFDREGFTVRFAWFTVRTYTWSDVTEVREDQRVFVRGKPLWVDPGFTDYPVFFNMARAACKGRGMTVPSEKKRKNRKKAKK